MRRSASSWRCVRHTHPDEVLSVENAEREVVLICVQDGPGRYWRQEGQQPGGMRHAVVERGHRGLQPFELPMKDTADEPKGASSAATRPGTRASRDMSRTPPAGLIRTDQRDDCPAVALGSKRSTTRSLPPTSSHSNLRQNPIDDSNGSGTSSTKPRCRTCSRSATTTLDPNPDRSGQLEIRVIRRTGSSLSTHKVTSALGAGLHTSKKSPESSAAWHAHPSASETTSRTSARRCARTRRSSSRFMTETLSGAPPSGDSDTMLHAAPASGRLRSVDRDGLQAEADSPIPFQHVLSG